MKFRKKPIVIEAIQYTGDNFKEVEEFLGHPSFTRNYASGLTEIAIPTLEGIMMASPKDWIIKGVKGEFYPCKPDIFKETYEKVVPLHQHPTPDPYEGGKL